MRKQILVRLCIKDKGLLLKRVVLAAGMNAVAIVLHHAPCGCITGFNFSIVLITEEKTDIMVT